jgi:hypothetical protein
MRRRSRAEADERDMPVGLVKRYRERQSAQARSRPEVIGRELLEEAERAERGELSDQEREALADKIADLAKEHLWRSHALAKIAMKVRTGRDH